MDDQTKTSETTPQNEGSSGKAGSEVLEELRELGRNLYALLQQAWESDERKKLQGEIEAGLKDLHGSLNQAAQEFAESPTGKTLKSDLEDLGQRIRSGEIENQVRNEVLSALRAANEGLKQSSAKKSPPPPDSQV